ncbi:MAG: transglycosylase domain-containing protein [Paraglaciecola sp.]|nr:transglycosylase domain-containing protein [Paraglaciecola sp.]
MLVQDPAFYNHNGVDIKSSGAGITTITQSFSKKLAFNEFKPGIGEIRQTTYALTFEKHLSKNEIFALFLGTVPMGKGPNGWVIGFFEAIQSFYGTSPHN